MLPPNLDSLVFHDHSIAELRLQKLDGIISRLFRRHFAVLGLNHVVKEYIEVRSIHGMVGLVEVVIQHIQRVR